MRASSFRSSVRAIALLAVAAAVLGSASASTRPAGPRVIADRGGWETFGNGNSRYSVASTSLVTASNAHRLRLAWSRGIGGVAVAQPLFLSAIAVRGRPVDIYVAASESGSVRAFRARDGLLLWKRNVGVVRTRCNQLPGGTFGVTGTPVFEPLVHGIFVAAVDRLWALDPSTGRSLAGWPVKLPLDPTHEHAWGALTATGTGIYVPLASYCDRRPYDGRVLRVDTGSRAVTSSWSTVGSEKPGGGGIWGYGGLSVTADGHLFVATANANGAGITDDATGHAESVVELDPQLRLLAASHATGMPHRGDYGFGSTPVVFRPKGCPELVSAEGKDGIVYLWRRAALASGPVQRLRVALPATLYGLTSWDARTQRLFLTTTAALGNGPSGLNALGIGPGCRLVRRWVRPLGGLLNSVPTLANDAVIVATGTGRLRVYSTRSGKAMVNRALGGPGFVAPIAVDDDVAAVTFGKRIVVYRLRRRWLGSSLGAFRAHRCVTASPSPGDHARRPA